MTAYVARPDPSPPGSRRIIYWLLCRSIRYPGLLRAVGSVFRAWPALLGGRWVARRSAVEHVLRRPDSFSNASHAPNLVAGDFLIGMEPGAQYDADHALFKSVLAGLQEQPGADREAIARSAALRDSGAQPFDLVEDYLMWVVLRALEPAFGAAAEPVLAGTHRHRPDHALERRYMHDVRHVAAHLFGGDTAPADVQRRAEVCGAALAARIHGGLPELSMSWPAPGAQLADLKRNAIGLAWVSHPVTVQGGALVVQELLGRPGVYRALRAQATRLGDEVWTDAGFRASVRGHVLELMRFRPVFPALSRVVPREAELETGARRNPVRPAGSSVGLMTLAALFDCRATPDAQRYCPMRGKPPGGPPQPWQMLMFGGGVRQCPASDQALTILTSAVIGLLTLPELGWADRWGRRIGYDGPMIARMNLRLQATP